MITRRVLNISNVNSEPQQWPTPHTASWAPHEATTLFCLCVPCSFV